jgi:hypothetical protein
MPVRHSNLNTPSHLYAQSETTLIPPREPGFPGHNNGPCASPERPPFDPAQAFYRKFGNMFY